MIAVEWPTARIPDTADELTLAHPVSLIPHWLDHGKLNILVDGPYVYVDADELLELLELDQDATRPQRARMLRGRSWYTLDDALAIANNEPTHQTLDFLAWLRPTIADLLDPEALALAVDLRSFLDAYTVRSAAQILDRDPGISIGRQTLFHHLEAQGWIVRIVDTWTPTALAIANAWLTLRDVVVRTGRDRTLYAQIHITPAGLSELRRTLRALNAAPTDPPPHPTLFED